MLTNKVTRTLPIPHEPGQTLTLRVLSFRQLDEARQVKGYEQVKAMRAFGTELMKEIQGLTRETAQEAVQEARQVAADPMDSYDRATLLRYGVVGWSYDAKCTPDAIGELDEMTADWAARQLIPELLQAGEDPKAE